MLDTNFMKCVSSIKIASKSKSKKQSKLDRMLKINRQARLLRKEQADNTKRYLLNGKNAEKVILDKLTKNLQPNYSIIDNNLTNKYSTMDFTSYFENKPITDIEHKYRIDYKHDHFYNGLMYGKNKFDYGVDRLKLGISHRIYWTCSDGIYYWELKDDNLQQDEYSVGPNCNKNINQKESLMVYVKCKYLKRFDY